MHGPSPADPHPMKVFPQVGFLKPLVKNPLIEVGEYAYYDDPARPEHFDKYTAEQEGLYGFYVIPESGAGLRAPDPRKGDQPMVLVEVVTSKPHCKIEPAAAGPGREVV